jgi:tungstate transport system substrate-binding protein
MLRCLVLALALMVPLSVSAQEQFITLASTTSAQQSGLLSHLIPLFRQQTGIDVRVVAVGSGRALQLGRQGEADALLVHDRAGEMKFMTEGHGLDRREVMDNSFVLVGPRTDPAGIKGHGSC